jgi:hypothetical protein
VSLQKQNRKGLPAFEKSAEQEENTSQNEKQEIQWHGDDILDGLLGQIHTDFVDPREIFTLDDIVNGQHFQTVVFFHHAADELIKKQHATYQPADATQVGPFRHGVNPPFMPSV